MARTDSGKGKSHVAMLSPLPLGTCHANRPTAETLTGNWQHSIRRYVPRGTTARPQLIHANPPSSPLASATISLL